MLRLVLLLSGALAGAASSNTATLEPAVSEEIIQDLSWESASELPVESDGAVLVRGRFPKKNFSLLLNESDLIEVEGPEGSFNFKIRMGTATESEFSLMAVNPAGEVEKRFYKIRVKAVQVAPAEAPRRLSLSAGLGPTLLSYQQTSVADVASTLLNAKLFAQYWLSPRQWDVAAGGYFTLASIGSNRPESTVRFLGLNIRTGYSLPLLPAPWSFSLMGGFYFATTFVSDQSFGYSNVAGPQVYPTIRRGFGSGASASAYFKFSPVSDSLSFLTLDSREIAWGGSWNFPPDSHGRAPSLQIDFANLKLAGEISSVNSTTYSASAGYNW